MAKKDLQEKRAAVITALAELGVVIITPEEIKDLTKEELELKLIDFQESTIVATITIFEDFDKAVVDLKSELDSKSTEIELKKHVVKIGSKKYQVNTPRFRLDGEIREYKDLETNPELAKNLLAIDGQNIVEEIK